MMSYKGDLENGESEQALKTGKGTSGTIENKGGA